MHLQHKARCELNCTFMQVGQAVTASGGLLDGGGFGAPWGCLCFCVCML